MVLSIEPTTRAASQARESLRAWGEEVDRNSLFDVRTVVSELVALSVVSGAAGSIDLQLELHDGEARGTVSDDGPAARALEQAGTRIEDSWTLQIVDGLVEDWGLDADRTAIWFRMPVRRLQEA
jgi:anti-sigma regulatory factor (Ser/Thr protein kinase)